MPSFSEISNGHMILFVSLLLWLSLLPLASATNSSVCTLSSFVANGTADQNCRVLCKPAKWTDVAIFYIGNYLAHVATVRNRPGLPNNFYCFIILMVLLCPVTGFAAAVMDISRLPVFGKTSLQKAARAGALYMVKEDVETTEPSFQENRKDGGPNISNTTTSLSSTRESDLEESISPVTNEHGSYDPENAVDVLSNQDTAAPLAPRLSDGWRDPSGGTLEIHGRVRLPSGWDLIEVPSNAIFENDAPQTSSGIMKWSFASEDSDNTKLAQDYGFIRAVIALGQTLYAMSTLYTTRGFQVQQLGYAAFGFTVIPYAFMSFINLMASLVCPVYPKVFLVENDDLRRLRDRITLEHRESSFCVEGVVGRIHTIPREDVPKKMARRARLTFLWLIGLFLFVVTYFSVVGALSHFRGRDSTLAQRVWTMTWVSSSTLAGVAGTTSLHEIDPKIGKRSPWVAYTTSILTLATWVFSIGGFVVVGQMILQIGICETI